LLQRQAPDSDSLFRNFKSERIKKRVHNPRDEASLAQTGVGVVDGIISDLAVMDVTRDHLQAKTGVTVI
jgi:acyl CoA:acetate/3-ketoacid CoA transferase beta subunit